MNELSILKTALNYLNESHYVNRRYVSEKVKSKKFDKPEPKLNLKSPNIKAIPTPESKINIKFNVPILIGVSIGMLFTGFGAIFIPLWIICYTFYYNNRRTNELNKIKTSVEYFNECEQIKQYNIQQQLAADEANKEIRLNYESELVKWKSEKSEYDSNMQTKISELKSKMGDLRQKCYSELDKINLPKKYRTVSKLETIIDEMESSNCTLDQACYIVDLKESEEKLNQQRIKAEQARQAAIEAQQNYESYSSDDYEEYYDNDDNYSNSSQSFVKTVAGVAIGSTIVNHYDRKKQAKLDAARESAEQKYRKEQEDKERRERMRAAAQSRYQRQKVIDENQKRRRRGEPELPIPPADWY